MSSFAVVMRKPSCPHDTAFATKGNNADNHNKNGIGWECMIATRQRIARGLMAGMLLAAGAGLTAKGTLFAQVMVTAAKPSTTAIVAAPTKTASTAPAREPLLPRDFAGWRIKAAATPITRAQQADPANAAALAEYGFTDGATAAYTRGNETMTLRALRFGDATGAYGAYTFYRHSGWPKEDIGSGAASDHQRILFWQGETFVDVTVSHVSAMTAADLRELAADLPRPATDKSLAPPVVADLPNVAGDGPLDPQTTHYALGPLGYAGSGGVLPPTLVGFDRGAEAVTANYALRSGPATLTLINYPTPQMAAAFERQISAFLQAGNTPAHPWNTLLANSTPGSVQVKRSGPLVAVVCGDAIPDDARLLLGLVHYDANISRLPGGDGPTEVQKTAKLLLGIVLLVAVMFAAALLLALLLGGGRALVRLAMGKPASSIYDEEFTRLDLN
jgi:hypothetical protein